MNDQEKARADLWDHAVRAWSGVTGREPTPNQMNALGSALTAVLSADPRVIAEAMGGYVTSTRLIDGTNRDTVIVLPREAGPA